MESGSNQLIPSPNKNQTIIKYSIILIFILAFGIRLYKINTHPLVAYPIKQYHCALFAQSYFYESQKHIEAPGKRSSIVYRKSRRIREPRIMEHLAYLGYQLIGEEQIWIPRLLSVLFWMFGGVLIYRLAITFFDHKGALFSLLFYFFLPFGINISQSFIPEALMTMFYIWSILMVFRYYQVPNKTNLIYAALISGVAILIKFIVIFPIFGGFIFLGIYKKGFKKFVFNVHTIQFFFISLIMGLVYYAYRLLFHYSLKGGLAQVYLPDLLFTSFFWKGWLQQISKVTGLIPFFLAILCFFKLRDRTVKALVLGMLSGYFFYGIIFIYTTATHDYYQIALFPIVVILLGQISKLVEGRVKIPFVQKKIGLSLVFSLLTLFIVVFSLVYNFYFLNHSTENKAKWPSILLCGNQFAYFSNNRIGPEIIAHAREIGEAVKHSTRTIILSGAYGIPLMYFGGFYGKSWPTMDDFWYNRLRGIPEPNATGRFNEYFGKVDPEYFIVHDKQLLDEQPGLKAFLKKRFTLIKEARDYMIFKIIKIKG